FFLFTALVPRRSPLPLHDALPIFEADDPILIGQIQLVDVHHPTKVKNAILREKEEILNLANNLHPKMVKRGGGAVDIEVMIHQRSEEHTSELQSRFDLVCRLLLA